MFSLSRSCLVLFVSLISATAFGENRDFGRGGDESSWERGPGYGRPGYGRPRPGRPGSGWPGRPGPGHGGGGYPAPVETIEVYRFFTGRAHFFTSNAGEGSLAGFQFQGTVFVSAAYQFPGSIAVYRCYTGGTHFMSNDPYCEGYRQEGYLGFLSQYPNGRMNREVVRCHNGFSHLITTNRQECYQFGYRIEMVLGYAF